MNCPLTNTLDSRDLINIIEVEIGKINQRMNMSSKEDTKGLKQGSSDSRVKKVLQRDSRDT